MSETEETPSYADDVQHVDRFIRSVYETWGAYANDEDRMKRDRDAVLGAFYRLIGENMDDEDQDPGPRYKHDCRNSLTSWA